DGICNEHVVDIVVKEGPERVREIIDWGTKFDKDNEGDYMRGREGGHSEFRILHHKDVTGLEIERALVEEIKRYPNIKGYNHCYGVYALNLLNNNIEKILARCTLMASGGVGQVYRTTTNPRIATGDGIAMAYRAKARIENMEFIQFHPTALYEAGISPSFLITEAVRGDGGILRNKNGEAFMPGYDPRADLAPRDVVARTIDSEMKRTGTEHVYLDCRAMDKDKFKAHFPNIYAKCKSIGIDVFEQMIPVAPAAHYCCGGIKVDEVGRSSIRNLY